jgi:hypothetical protein
MCLTKNNKCVIISKWRLNISINITNFEVSRYLMINSIKRYTGMVSFQTKKDDISVAFKLKRGDIFGFSSKESDIATVVSSLFKSSAIIAKKTINTRKEPVYTIKNIRNIFFNVVRDLDAPGKHINLNSALYIRRSAFVCLFTQFLFPEEKIIIRKLPKSREDHISIENISNDIDLSVEELFELISRLSLVGLIVLPLPSNIDFSEFTPKIYADDAFFSSNPFSLIDKDELNPIIPLINGSRNIEDIFKTSKFDRHQVLGFIRTGIRNKKIKMTSSTGRDFN